MPKRRPDQHVTGDKACQQFEASLPSQWVVRPQSSDYGIDREVEVFDQGVSTGIVFKAQIKGTHEPTHLSDDATISFPLDVDDAQYFCEELRVPTVLVLVDVSADRVWWHAVQLDRGLAARLRAATIDDQKTITVHLAVAHELPGTEGALVSAVLEAEAVLGARVVSTASSQTILNALRSTDDLDAMLAGLERGVSFTKLSILERLWQTRQHDAVAAKISEIVESQASSGEVRFVAWLYWEKLAVRQAQITGRPNDIPSVEYTTALRLKSVADQQALHLRCYAAFAMRCAQLHAFAQQDFALYLNAIAHRDSCTSNLFDPMWALMMPGARHRAVDMVLRKFRQCVRLLSFMVENDAIAVLGPSVVRLLMATWQFQQRLWFEGMEQAAAHWESVLEDIADAAVRSSLALEDWDTASQIAVHACSLANPDDPESQERRRQWSEKIASSILDVSMREQALVGIEGAMDAIQSAAAARQTPPDEDDLEAEREVYEAMASAMGVDLTDPDDDIAQIVRIGIDDLNPGRILRHCKHLYVRLHGGGLPAAMLKMPTAGRKTLWCTLHGHGTSALRLDGAYAAFESGPCQDCNDRCPHPDDWAWTRAWQREQDALHGETFGTT